MCLFIHIFSLGQLSSISRDAASHCLLARNVAVLSGRAGRLGADSSCLEMDVHRALAFSKNPPNSHVHVGLLFLKDK